MFKNKCCILNGAQEAILMTRYIKKAKRDNKENRMTNIYDFKNYISRGTKLRMV